MNETEAEGRTTKKPVKPRKESVTEFHVRRGLFGYEVTPPAGELWFEGSNSPKIRIHNHTEANLLAEVVDEKAKGKMTRPSDHSDSQTKVASLEFAPNAKPEVAEFNVLIWCEPCDGVVFRARARSDPRVRVMP